MFIFRTFYSKMKNLSFTISTFTVLIALTLISLNISSLFKGMFDIKQIVPHLMMFQLLL